MKKVEEGREDPAIPDAGEGAGPAEPGGATSSNSDASSRGRGSRDYLAEVTSSTSGLSETSFSPAVGQLAKALSVEGTHGCWYYWGCEGPEARGLSAAVAVAPVSPRLVESSPC